MFGNWLNLFPFPERMDTGVDEGLIPFQTGDKGATFRIEVPFHLHPYLIYNRQGASNPSFCKPPVRASRHSRPTRPAKPLQTPG